MIRPRYQLRLSAFVSPSSLVFIMIVSMTAFSSIGSGIALLLLAIPIFFVPALYLTLAKPQRTIDEYGLVPLAAEADTRLLSGLSTIAISLGLRRIPVVLMVEDRLAAEPFAFGTFARTYLAIPRSYVESHGLDPDEFDAVIRHELAHLVSGDIWMFEMSKSIAQVFPSVWLIIACFSAVWPLWARFDSLGLNVMLGYMQWLYSTFITHFPVSETAAASLERIVGFYGGLDKALLVPGPGWAWILTLFGMAFPFFAICLRILVRTRELYADALASADQGSLVLDRAIVRLGLKIVSSSDHRIGGNRGHLAQKARRLINRVIGRWRRFHPSFAERLACLRDSTQVLPYFALVSLVGGMVGEMANWITLLRLRAIYADDEPSSYLLPFFLGVLLMGVINGPLVAGCHTKPGRVMRSIVTNVALYSLAVLVIQLACSLATNAGLGLWESVYRPDLSASPLFDRALFIRVEIVRPILFLSIVFPLALVVGGAIGAALQHALIRTKTHESFTQLSILGTALIGIGLWFGLLEPLVRVYGASSPPNWPSSTCLLGLMCLGVVIRWAISESKRPITCERCGADIVQAKPDLVCAVCGYPLFGWAITVYE